MQYVITFAIKLNIKLLPAKIYMGLEEELNIIKVNTVWKTKQRRKGYKFQSLQ